MEFKVPNANSAPFWDLEGWNQFPRHFLHTRKLYLNVTSCDLLEFLLWRDVICLAPIIIFHTTFAECCVHRYLHYWNCFVHFGVNGYFWGRIFGNSKTRLPNKEIRMILIFFTPGVWWVCPGVHQVCARLGTDGYLCLSLMSFNWHAKLLNGVCIILVTTTPNSLPRTSATWLAWPPNSLVKHHCQSCPWRQHPTTKAVVDGRSATTKSAVNDGSNLRQRLTCSHIRFITWS